MTQFARWNLTVSRDTNEALRQLLAKRSGRSLSLSRFVEEAVNREMLRRTVQDVRSRNADLPEDEAMARVEQALDDVRAGAERDPRP